jgi:hypothetical protein
MAAPPVAPAPEAPIVTSSPARPAGAATTPAEVWRQILATFEAQRPRLAGALAHAEVRELAPGRLTLAFSDRFGADSVEKARADIEQALTAAFGQPTRLIVNLGAASPGLPAVLRSEVGAENDALASDRKIRENEARQHPIVRKAQDVFGAGLKEIKT